MNIYTRPKGNTHVVRVVEIPSLVGMLSFFFFVYSMYIAQPRYLIRDCKNKSKKNVV